MDSVPASTARTFFETAVVDIPTDGDAGFDTLSSGGGRIVTSGPRGGYATYKVKESVEAKLARLRREVEEVKMELGAGEKYGEQKGEVEGLQEVLKKLEITTSNKTENSRRLYSDLNIDDEPSQETSKSDDTSADATHRQDIKQLVQFEARVAKLESIVGLAEIDPQTVGYRPLLETLRELRQRLKLLTSTPVAVETAITNLRPLIAAMDQVKAARAPVSASTAARKPSSAAADSEPFNRSEALVASNSSAVFSPEQAATIQKLYKDLPALAQLQTAMPKVLARLKALRRLHLDAESTNEYVGSMDAAIRGLRTDLKTWQQTLEQVEEKVGQVESTSKSNRKEVEEWVADLKSRQDALKSA